MPRSSPHAKPIGHPHLDTCQVFLNSIHKLPPIGVLEEPELVSPEKTKMSNNMEGLLIVEASPRPTNSASWSCRPWCTFGTGLLSNSPPEWAVHVLNRMD